MPDIKDMEGPVKFKKGVELYFDPKKDMFYDPKKKKYMSEKDILALGEETELFEKSEEYQKFFQSALKKFGIDSPAELDDKKKKEFFDYVDKNWEGENEEDEEETIEELNIGMSFAGNGLSVYDRDREESGDYMKIAHIQGKPNRDVKDGDDITLNIYDKKKSNHKAIIAKVEKSFPKSKIKVDDRSKMKMTQEELSLGESYDIKTRMKVHKAMMKKYGNDPYYKQVIDALLSHGTADMEKAIKSLVAIRGDQALKNLQRDMKSMLGEELKIEEAISEKLGPVIVISYNTNGKPYTTVIRKEENIEETVEERIQEMFDLGDKVKRKDGSEEGEVIQRRTDDKSVGGRYKLKLKNGSRSKWINGNSLELVEQFSQKMKKYVDACGKDFTNWK